MDLSISEPKKKGKTKSGPTYPFPIVFDSTNEWKIYTAYLNDTGSCIVDEDDMKSVHLMVRSIVAMFLRFCNYL